jgi:hypothetical protein
MHYRGRRRPHPALGKLKQAAGGQTYDLPKGEDLGPYTTLLVWSKKEKRAVTRADPPAGSHPTLARA